MIEFVLYIVIALIMTKVFWEYRTWIFNVYYMLSPPTKAEALVLGIFWPIILFFLAVVWLTILILKGVDKCL